MKKWQIGFLLLTLISGAVIAQQKIIYINAATVNCTGVGPMECLQYKNAATDNWLRLYTPIEGFKYQAGYMYTLLVMEDKIEQPPAGGSSVKLSLIKIVDKQKATIKNEQILTGSYTLQQLMLDNKLTDVSSNGFQFSITENGFSTKFCNTIRGKFWLQPEGILSIGPAMSTRMKCPDMQFEQAFNQCLKMLNQYKMENGQLQLLKDGKAWIILQKVVENEAVSSGASSNIDYAAMLQQTTYKVASITDEEGTVSLKGTAATMRFDVVKNSMGGKGICNTYFASANVQFTSDNAGKMTIGQGGSTMMACPTNMDLESRFLKIISQAESFEMKGGQLLIKKGNKVIIELES